MKRLKSFALALIVTVGVLGAVLLGTQSVSHGRHTVRPLVSASSTTVETLPPGSGIAIDGGAVIVSATTQTPHLSPAEAYAGYLKWVGGSSAFDVRPTYLFGLFSDKNVQDPNDDGALVVRWRDVQVWAIMFRNVEVSPVGKGVSNQVLNDVTYFVSDNTGAVLEELTSPITVET
jgi:hypothetical protein